MAEYNPITMGDPNLEAQNAYNPMYTQNEYNPNAWKGMGTTGKTGAFDMYNQPIGGQKSQAFKSSLATGALTLGRGLLSPEPFSKTGFIIAGLIQLAGGLLGAIFSKPQLTPEQQYFNRIVNFYSDLGKRSAYMRNTISKMTSKPANSYIGKIGYRDEIDAFNQRATFKTGYETRIAKKNRS